MIKNYKQFNESLRDLMVGPTEDEALSSLKGLSPNKLLIKSCRIGLLKGVEIALGRGANLHIYDDQCLRQSASYGNTDVVKLLLDRGANIHALNDSPLNNAIDSGHGDTVELLKSYMNKNK